MLIFATLKRRFPADISTVVAELADDPKITTDCDKVQHVVGRE